MPDLRPFPGSPAPVRVWAPRARTVTLVLTFGPDVVDRLPMAPEDDGWWRSRQELEPGTDYAFSLDDGPPLPDPRSPWQPAGVHGLSRTFDAGLHTWADDAWPGRSVLGAVFYELHVGTFTPEGTLDAATERLDHLVGLGVDVVELMPVAAFNGRHGWGYDGVALWAVHDPYGGPAALQRFVDAAHARGLAVCLDVVDNHLGPSGNYLGQFGPYFTDRHSTPWGDAVNLDGDDAGPVRAFVVEKALRWLRDFHVDALRLDAVHALVDDSPRHVLAELADAVAALERELGRPLSLVAESDLNDARMVTPTGQALDGRPGLGMTAQWSDDLHHALYALLTGERQGYYVDFGSPETLAKALSRVFVHDGGWSTFRGRDWGAPVPDDVDGRRFVVCSQNHDQVGNRALGDRPSRVLPGGRLAVSAAVVLLGPGTPLLFMGEEWGASTPFQYFTDHGEPELAEAVREGRAAELAAHRWTEVYGREIEVPDPQSPETFARSRLDWAELEGAPHGRLLQTYRELVRLRHALPEVASGDRRATRVRTGDGWLVMTRGGTAGATDVVVCWSDDGAVVPLDGEGREVLLAWAPVDVQPAPDATTTVTLHEPGFAVMRRQAAS
ncbi:malto-oligosyltrehalose trehalohydrolase [Xylanimonas sp. McL0601]|uniref:malto-oligosyltrehalose trehalohydrolase n=1 Tax=Xylanimonas sp. McL0601 TaxID=3414739 RepID=UPI003CFBBEED